MEAAEILRAEEEDRPRAKGGVDTCWSVAVIAALNSFIATVAISNSGFIFVGLMSTLGVDREGASWPASVMAFAFELSGKVLCEQLHV